MMTVSVTVEGITATVHDDNRVDMQSLADMMRQAALGAGYHYNTVHDALPTYDDLHKEATGDV